MSSTAVERSEPGRSGCTPAAELTAIPGFAPINPGCAFGTYMLSVNNIEVLYDRVILVLMP
jgi:hypothetical protein